MKINRMDEDIIKAFGGSHVPSIASLKVGRAIGHSEAALASRVCGLARKGLIDKTKAACSLVAGGYVNSAKLLVVKFGSKKIVK